MQISSGTVLAGELLELTIPDKSSYSACNPRASCPPVIVDQDGGFHGRLTVNRRPDEATWNEGWVIWLGREVCV